MYDSYAIGRYVAAGGLADSQRPFVWMRLRISPLASAAPHGFRLSSTGKWLYGALPSWTIRSAPIGPAYPTSITFEASMFIPTLNPARKTVAATSTQTGQNDLVGVPRPWIPIHTVRPSR